MAPLPDASRIFGRVHACIVECWLCGRIHHLGFSGYPKLHRSWNRVTQQVQCRCRAVFVVGLVVWPTHKTHAQPSDTRPTRAQLLEMRRQASGIWVESPRRRQKPVNLHMAAECLCRENGKVWAVGCPIHGDASQVERGGELGNEEDEAARLTGQNRRGVDPPEER